MSSIFAWHLILVKKINKVLLSVIELEDPLDFILNLWFRQVQTSNATH